MFTYTFQNLVELATNTPLHDECVYQVPIEIVSRLLQEVPISCMTYYFTSNSKCRMTQNILLYIIYCNINMYFEFF